MTLTEMVDQALVQISDSSDKAKSIVKTGINRGLTRLRTKLRRAYTIETVTFSYVGGQSQYKAPTDIIRGGEVYVTLDGERTALKVIDDINDWDGMRAESSTADRPEFVRWVEPDIFEVFPVPSADITNGGSLRYQALAKPLTQEDYTTGTVALTNGSKTVTGTGTTFTTDMTGRVLRLADGNSHIAYYEIAAFVSATEVTLETAWGGETVTDKNFKIGERPNLPEMHHYSLIDEGIRRYYLHRKDVKQAKEYGSNFDIDEIEAEADFEGLEHSSVIESKHSGAGMVDPFKVKEIN